MILAVALAASAVGFALLAGGSGARTGWFLAGIGALAAALVSPVHGWSERSLAGHMVQHVLLISVAAPLLAAARPFDTVRQRRQRVAPAPGVDRSRRDEVIGASALAAAGVLQVSVLLGWHLPVLFDAAVAHQPLHDVEHLTLLASAFALWAMLLRARDGGAVVALFVATLPAMAYGVALTLAGTTWYAPYPDLRDQQLAGVVMWAYGGLLAVVGGVALAVEWLRRAERNSPGWVG